MSLNCIAIKKRKTVYSSISIFFRNRLYGILRVNNSKNSGHVWRAQTQVKAEREVFKSNNFLILQRKKEKKKRKKRREKTYNGGYI
jgi:hypothetical protein